MHLFFKRQIEWIRLKVFSSFCCRNIGNRKAFSSRNYCNLLQYSICCSWASSLSGFPHQLPIPYSTNPIMTFSKAIQDPFIFWKISSRCNKEISYSWVHFIWSQDSEKNTSFYWSPIKSFNRARPYCYYLPWSPSSSPCCSAFYPLSQMSFQTSPPPFLSSSPFFVWLRLDPFLLFSAKDGRRRRIKVCDLAPLIALSCVVWDFLI